MPWSLSKTIKKHKSTTNFLVRDCTFVSEVSLEPRPDKSLIGKQFWLFWLKIPYPSIKPRLTACHINKPIVGANLKSLESQNALLYFHYFQSDKVMKWERVDRLECHLTSEQHVSFSRLLNPNWSIAISGAPTVPQAPPSEGPRIVWKWNARLLHRRD